MKKMGLLTNGGHTVQAGESNRSSLHTKTTALMQFFDSAAQTLYHKDHICDLLSTIASPNLKLKSVHLDLQDPKVVAILHIFAMVGLKLTTPYWELVTSDSVHYLDLSEPIQKMYGKICHWVEDPKALLDPEEDPVFGQFPPTKDALFQCVFRDLEEDVLPLATSVAQSLCYGLKNACEKQLIDFLVDGVYANCPTEEEKNSTHSTLTNLSYERNFGTLDSSQQRRKNATFHYHTAVLLLKAQGKNMLKWLAEHNDRSELWTEARKMGKALREVKKANEKKVLEEIDASNVKKLSNREKRGTKKGAKPNEQSGERSSSKTNQNESIVSNINNEDWVCVAYEDRWYIGQVLSMSEKKLEVKFLHPGRNPGTFKRPARPDVENIEHRFVLALIPQPVEVSNGRMFRILNQENLDELYARYQWL